MLIFTLCAEEEEREIEIVFVPRFDIMGSEEKKKRHDERKKEIKTTFWLIFKFSHWHCEAAMLS